MSDEDKAKDTTTPPASKPPAVRAGAADQPPKKGTAKVLVNKAFPTIIKRN